MPSPWLKPCLRLTLIAALLFGGWRALVEWLVKRDLSANPWESQISAFASGDRTNAPPKGAILFVGSSSIRLWKTLKKDFAEYRVFRRGFGGSHITDAAYYADRIILPYEPSRVLVYAGDNDLAAGKSPEQVLADFQQLVAGIHEELPEANIAFISIKPSLARWHLIHRAKRANALIRDFTDSDGRLCYVDVFSPMLTSRGQPRPELFAADGLHLSAKGYGVWTTVIKAHFEEHDPPVEKVLVTARP